MPRLDILDMTPRQLSDHRKHLIASCEGLKRRMSSAEPALADRCVRTITNLMQQVYAVDQLLLPQAAGGAQ